MANNHPCAFITYSWEDTPHNTWVKSLADRLICDGVDTLVDQYDLTLGDRLPQFMEQSITGVDYVLIVCTPTYKKKADSRVGGVGYEGHIISNELFTKHNDRKFIPILRKGNASESMPTYLSGKLWVDLSGDTYSEDHYHDLLATLTGMRSKPALGQKPPRTITSRNKANARDIDKPDEPIRILGIMTDEVTVPKMDGTRGSALYAIPFRLSRYPSELWKKIFLETWRFPPRFTTMHRSKIASVLGDKIILDGTTIEEVQQYHRETLIACVETANKEEAKLLEEKRQAEEMQKNRESEHYSNVQDIAKKIKF